jgi:hypothetical protein
MDVRLDDDSLQRNGRLQRGDSQAPENQRMQQHNAKSRHQMAAG